MASTDYRAQRTAAAPQQPRREDATRDRELLFDENDAGGAWDSSAPENSPPYDARNGFHEDSDEQSEFREQFDEDLYNDRKDPPTQGNTADVAMGEGRFGSDGEAYAEYAHRRPGEDSSVGVARDPADIADTDLTDEDEQP